MPQIVATEVAGIEENHKIVAIITLKITKEEAREEIKSKRKRQVINWWMRHHSHRIL
jgi:hypothetical protein